MGRSASKPISREIGRVYEKHIGRTGNIGSVEDILKRPGQVYEDLYKKSPAYYTGKAVGKLIPKMPKIPTPTPTTTPHPRPTSIVTESAKQRARFLMKKRRGFASTMMTRGITLGAARTQRARTLGA